MRHESLQEPGPYACRGRWRVPSSTLTINDDVGDVSGNTTAEGKGSTTVTADGKHYLHTPPQPKGEVEPEQKPSPSTLALR